ncbi:MAG TPA: AMP-binding protein [Thermoanaerobaculia bacterium]|nr:AMP-binding protein [Thermoanaerobaculia bacterium]
MWLATSGTTGALKLTALSKRAMLASASAVNRHLASDANDVWSCVLPTFHVGGLGILARAYQSGAGVIVSSWDARQFAAAEKVTLASLVPAQVADLVALRLQPPSKLRAIVVGGAALPEAVYKEAQSLGWPLLPSYGMTETCSQVATAAPGSPSLILLDHVEARVERDGRLAFAGQSLLTGYGTVNGFVDPKTDGWLITDDLGDVDGRTLRVGGRKGEFVKIGGESVDLARLDAILATIAGADAAVAAIPDQRLGHVIHLAVVHGSDAGAIAEEFRARVHPFERPRRVHVVRAIPRSALGKLMRAALVAQLPISLE